MPTLIDVNPYSEIWPLEHDAQVWGHRPGGRSQIQEKEKSSVTEIQKRNDVRDGHERGRTVGV